MAFEFFVKNDLIFGRGAIERLSGVLAGYGAKRLMLVYDAGVKAAGIADKVLAQMEGLDIIQK